MIDILSFCKKLFLMIFVFILYGYCELKHTNSSRLITLTLILSIIWLRGHVLFPILSFIIDIYLRQYNELKSFYNLPFLGLCFYLYFIIDQNDNNLELKLKPYEKEIRQLLWKYNPQILHTVDDLLIRHRWYEKELYHNLKVKYEILDTSKNDFQRGNISNTTFDLPETDENNIKKVVLDARSAIRQRMKAL